MTKASILEIQRLISVSKPTKAHLSFLMNQLRLLIEENNLKEKYLYLNLYCNWAHHSKIEGSKTAFRILESITDSLINHNLDPHTSKWITDAVIEGIGLHLLQDEIIKIGQQFNIKGINRLKILNNWKLVASKLVDLLKDSPIQFPDTFRKNDDKSIAIYDSILAKAKAAGNQETMSIVGFEFLKEKGKYLWRIITLSSKTIHKDTKIIGELSFIDLAMVEKYKNK